MPDSHLDDEQLSAVLDGLAGDEHVRDCARCAARLDALRTAATLVASPPAPLPVDAVDELVAHAIAEASQPISIENAKRARRESRARRFASPGALGAVAAVLMVLLAVPLVLRSTADSDRGSTANVQLADGDAAGTASGGATASGDAATAETESRAAAPMTESFAAGTAAGAFDPASLGPIETEDELVRALRTNVPPQPVAARESEEPPTTTPPALCEDAAREVGGARLGGRIYTADVIWRSTDAEVLVFDLTEPIDGQARQAYVMSRQGCRVLAEPRF